MCAKFYEISVKFNNVIILLLYEWSQSVYTEWANKKQKMR